ncbi:MAG: abortive infection family protein [Deltaproteobacteria bacterium]|nr:abortive infection family protein [Deltaproteobacteria bacterium]
MTIEDFSDYQEDAESLRNLLVSKARGSKEEANWSYQRLRDSFYHNDELKSLLPRFVRTCSTLNVFDRYIKQKIPSNYQGRQKFIYKEFDKLINNLKPPTPSDVHINKTIKKFDKEFVFKEWEKALKRRDDDPEGAITASRSLLESVCKHILDEIGVDYDNKSDLRKLYKATATNLNISPSQDTEQDLKKILSGVFSIVQGLGSLRNKIGVAHGQGEKKVEPNLHYAELAVNLSGALASFLIATYEMR